MVLARRPHPDVRKQLIIDPFAAIPREHVVSFNASLRTEMPLEELLLMMQKIERLFVYDVKLSKGFLQPNPDGPFAHAKLLPSLRSLDLKVVTLGDGN
jgi:hypothetical protein